MQELLPKDRRMGAWHGGARAPCGGLHTIYLINYDKNFDALHHEGEFVHAWRYETV